MYFPKFMQSVCQSAVSSTLPSLFGAAVLSLPLVTATAFTLAAQPASAMPVCSSAAADPDGDGWGWENFQTCEVSGSSAASASTASAFSGFPVCSASNDTDGDGWGWENNQSCVFGADSTASTNSSAATSSISGGDAAAVAALAAFPTCSASLVDADGDGWGWDNNTTCLFRGESADVNASQTSATFQSTQTQESQIDSATGAPVCLSTASDPNNDGWGFENGVSCVVTSSSGAASAATSVITPGVAPPPVAAASPGFADGHPICLTDASDDGNNGFGYENNQTCRVVSGVTATRSNPLLNQRSCIPWLEIGYGNYRLQNNTWNSTAVYNNNWSQCIELTGGPGNYVAKWDYNWLDRSQGNEFAVKSYPQAYIGRKTQYNLSGSVAETGMPVRIDSMPQFRVDYNYAETGIVERNVALESFMHNSCDAEEYNKQFEMMIWVGVPTIRTPGTLVASVTLSGQEWDVFTNPALGWAYVAFVAKQPSTSGSLDWNEFIYWSRDVGPSFGVPYMNPNSCMGAIEIGTETFWGTGTFTLNRFDVTRG